MLVCLNSVQQPSTQDVVAMHTLQVLVDTNIALSGDRPVKLLTGTILTQLKMIVCGNIPVQPPYIIEPMRCLL